jgi:Tfp pilus assembly PilM family ATPase
MISNLQSVLKKFDHSPKDVVGLDFGATGIKCVRLKKIQGEIVLTGADIIAPVRFPANPESVQNAPVLVLPKIFHAAYAALALPSDQAIIKVLSFPGEFTAETEHQIVPHMGLEHPEIYRINYKILVNGHARSESRVLAVAYPAAHAAFAPRLIPAGPPAPCSIEIAGLATLSAFMKKLEKKGTSETVGHLEMGENSSLFSLFTRSIPVLIRKFEFGVDSVMHQVRQGLGVPPQVAIDIVSSGSIDISHWVSEAAQPFIKQLLVSRDFVERRENCRIRQFFLSGGGGAFAPLRREVEQAFDLEFMPWNPLEAFPSETAVIGEGVRGQECRLTAAVGAALSVLESA